MDFATPAPAMPGALIAGRYRLVRPLGAGSSATVWEAADTALDRTVAVKLLHSSALADPTERERLRREALALARLAHPRVTIVFDYLEQTQPDGSVQPVLVTELLNGMTLAERLRIGPMPVADAVAVCAQLADALRAAHEAGIVHRDVKPANVVLTPGGAKLLDFGIALASSDSNLTGSMAIGTPACMAPEQLTGRGAVPASDVYALGCVMYWCLTGRPPFDSSNVAQVAEGHVYAPAPPLTAPGVPQGVVDVYQRCMAKDPAQRPSAADVFAFLSLPMSSLTPTAQRTMVMPSFDAPTQTTALAGRGRGGPAAAGIRASGGPGGRGNPDSRGRLLIGALIVAAAAAGITALVLNSAHSKAAGAGSAPPSASPTAATSSAPASPSPNSPSPADTATAGTGTATGTGNQNLGDPAADPVGYVEAMRSQIDGFIAQGQDTIDPNAGRDLQNSLSDLENAITTAQNNGGGRQQQRAVRQKIDAIDQKINNDLDNGDISQDAANQLAGELQNLANAMANNNGGNN
jgi:serine/threonine-protein kinase